MTVETFYNSNTTPQITVLNRGIFKKLVFYTRKFAYDMIACLSGVESVSFGNRYIVSVAVQDYFWKIIYIEKSDIVEEYSLLSRYIHVAFRNNCVNTTKSSIDV